MDLVLNLLEERRDFLESHIKNFSQIPSNYFDDLDESEKERQWKLAIDDKIEAEQMLEEYLQFIIDWKKYIESLPKKLSINHEGVFILKTNILKYIDIMLQKSLEMISIPGENSSAMNQIYRNEMIIIANLEAVKTFLNRI